VRFFTPSCTIFVAFSFRDLPARFRPSLSLSLPPTPPLGRRHVGRGNVVPPLVGG